MKIKNNKFIIAIDGPASSGKSTTAKILAKKLNCIYLDSGSMYRALAIYLLEQDIDINNEIMLKKVLSKVDIKIICQSKIGDNTILLNGNDVSLKIRNPDITNYSSIIATKQIIRERMVELQRKIAGNQSIIMDGRDIGTVVFPDADFKFFLTASLSERAKRRWLELKNKSRDYKSLQKVEQDLEKRDYLDKTRKIAPLKMAEDAILIDTTDLTIAEQVEKIENIIKNEITI
ncbi:MAG: (d)CMP kinase [Candidatus Cloacimonetes bacterium]|nr:(d)CMP kinase [Candidatus Cloacimonadota bacterium]MBL7085968.1 (d)CMP kinase [Candidatus Cloacimonadota bacterium]